MSSAQDGAVKVRPGADGRTIRATAAVPSATARAGTSDPCCSPSTVPPGISVAPGLARQHIRSLQRRVTRFAASCARMRRCAACAERHDPLGDCALDSYETLTYEQDGHVVTLTLQPPRPAQRGEPHDELRAAPRLAAVPRRRRRIRARDHRSGRHDVLRRLGPRRRGEHDRDPRLRRLPHVDLQLAGRVRIHAPRRHLQARDRGRERLCLRRGSGDGAAGRHPDRRRERRVRSARAALEHRRRGRDDGAGCPSWSGSRRPWS